MHNFPFTGRNIPMVFPNTSQSSKSTPSLQTLEANRVTNFVDQPFEEMIYGPVGDEKSMAAQKHKLVTRAFSSDSKPTRILGTLLGLGRKKRFEFLPFTQSEFIDRVKKWVVTSVDLIVLSSKYYKY